MKVTDLLLTIVLSLLTISCINGQKIVYADGTKKLNNDQQNLLEFTKKTYLSDENKILLPTEISVLLGDSSTTENIVAQPLWKKAYFVKEKKTEALIIPMQSNYNDIELYSDLIVVKQSSVYSNIVSTYLECKSESSTKYIQIESTTKGEFYRAMVRDENNNVIATYGKQDFKIPYGKEGNKYLTNHKNLFMRDQILYKNDWLPGNGTEFWYRDGSTKYLKK